MVWFSGSARMLQEGCILHLSVVLKYVAVVIVYTHLVIVLWLSTLFLLLMSNGSRGFLRTVKGDG